MYRWQSRRYWGDLNVGCVQRLSTENRSHLKVANEHFPPVSDLPLTSRVHSQCRKCCCTPRPLRSCSCCHDNRRRRTARTSTFGERTPTSGNIPCRVQRSAPPCKPLQTYRLLIFFVFKIRLYEQTFCSRHVECAVSLVQTRPLLDQFHFRGAFLLFRRVDHQQSGS